MNFLDMLRRNPHGWGQGVSLDPALDAPVQPGDETWRGGIWPIRTVSQGTGEPDAMEWAMPGLIGDTWNAITTPWRLLSGEAMTPEEINRSAGVAAGMAMTGGLVAPRPPAVASNALMRPVPTELPNLFKNQKLSGGSELFTNSTAIQRVAGDPIASQNLMRANSTFSDKVPSHDIAPRTEHNSTPELPPERTTFSNINKRFEEYAPTEWIDSAKADEIAARSATSEGDFWQAWNTSGRRPNAQFSYDEIPYALGINSTGIAALPGAERLATARGINLDYVDILRNLDRDTSTLHANGSLAGSAAGLLSSQDHRRHSRHSQAVRD